MAAEPVSEEIASSLARFFSVQGSPSHREISEIFERAELDAFDPAEGAQNIGKERRVRAVLETSQHPSERSRQCVLQLLASLRSAGSFESSSSSYAGAESVGSAKRAFKNAGWALDDDGRLGPLVLAEIETAERRPAIELQIDRMRNGSSDAALLIGTAKELLESTARYVLEELGQEIRDNIDFDSLLYLARDRLDIHPARYKDPSEKTLQQIFQSLWSVAETVNQLRREAGTGHGGTDPSTIPSYAARSVVQAAGVMAQLMITRLDIVMGRRSS
ncbi:MAG: hypothetical protein GEU75_00135 [Dehalococcoidia bacterium]|nr:hypothetical protein [Dehalococcoidia bacterium]